MTIRESHDRQEQGTRHKNHNMTVSSENVFLSQIFYTHTHTHTIIWLFNIEAENRAKVSIYMIKANPEKMAPSGK